MVETTTKVKQIRIVGNVDHDRWAESEESREEYFRKQNRRKKAREARRRRKAAVNDLIAMLNELEVGR